MLIIDRKKELIKIKHVRNETVDVWSLAGE